MRAQAEPTDCERLRELLPAYSVGALNADEARQVEQLLPNCPELHADARAYARLARALHYAPTSTTPAPELRERLLKEAALAAAFLHQSQATTALPPGRALPDRKPPLPDGRAAPKRRWLTPALVGLAALLIVTNLYWYMQVSMLQFDIDVEATARAELVGQVVMLQREQAALMLVSSPDARSVNLMSADGATAYARVSWLPDSGQAVMRSAALPLLERDQTYQLWLVPADGVPVSAGVFDVNGAGSATLIFDMIVPMDSLSALGISVEPQGGSPAPTSDPLAVGLVGA